MFLVQYKLSSIDRMLLMTTANVSLFAKTKILFTAMHLQWKSMGKDSSNEILKAEMHFFISSTKIC